MCVIVPTRSVYLFGIRMSYQKGCAIARLDGSTL